MQAHSTSIGDTLFGRADAGLSRDMNFSALVTREIIQAFSGQPQLPSPRHGYLTHCPPDPKIEETPTWTCMCQQTRYGDVYLEAPLQLFQEQKRLTVGEWPFVPAQNVLSCLDEFLNLLMEWGVIHRLTEDQHQAIINALHIGVNLISGLFGSAKTYTLAISAFFAALYLCPVMLVSSTNRNTDILFDGVVQLMLKVREMGDPNQLRQLGLEYGLDQNGWSALKYEGYLRNYAERLKFVYKRHPHLFHDCANFGRRYKQEKLRVIASTIGHAQTIVKSRYNMIFVDELTRADMQSVFAIFGRPTGLGVQKVVYSFTGIGDATQTLGPFFIADPLWRFAAFDEQGLPNEQREEEEARHSFAQPILKQICNKGGKTDRLKQFSMQLKLLEMLEPHRICILKTIHRMPDFLGSIVSDAVYGPGIASYANTNPPQSNPLSALHLVADLIDGDNWDRLIDNLHDPRASLLVFNMTNIAKMKDKSLAFRVGRPADDLGSFDGYTPEKVRGSELPSCLLPEAIVVVSIAIDLLLNQNEGKECCPPEELMLITPLIHQRDLLQDLLRAACTHLAPKLAVSKVRVMTLGECQGDEAPIVILSPGFDFSDKDMILFEDEDMYVSELDEAGRRILKHHKVARRPTVAMSRMKNALVVVGTDIRSLIDKQQTKMGIFRQIIQKLAEHHRIVDMSYELWGN